MAVGLINPNITMKWYGDAAVRFVKGILHTKMENAGKAVVARARQLCPVDTGQTRASIGATYEATLMSLRIHVDTYWAVFLEFGTSKMPARPFLRPALKEFGKFLGFAGSTELHFQAPEKYQYKTSSGKTKVHVRKFDHKAGHPLR
jgi:HK97 gp10 family phage protein